jgi:hypothetical protein
MSGIVLKLWGIGDWILWDFHFTFGIQLWADQIFSWSGLREAIVCFMCFMKHTNKPAPSPAPDYYYHDHHGSMSHVKNGGIHSHFGVHTNTKLWYSSCIYKTKIGASFMKELAKNHGFWAVLPFLFIMKRMQSSISKPVL